eukprot:scaffold1890_cov105-Isochrysis_galbana.AAC.3
MVQCTEMAQHSRREPTDAHHTGAQCRREPHLHQEPRRRARVHIIRGRAAPAARRRRRSDLSSAFPVNFRWGRCPLFDVQAG